jgi:hypothetical protein
MLKSKSQDLKVTRQEICVISVDLQMEPMLIESYTCEAILEEHKVKNCPVS